MPKTALQALAAWARETQVGQQCGQHLALGGKLAVAFSGGADSSAMLLASVQHWGASQVVAIHVNHGLQAAAEQFEAHCAAVCHHLQVELRSPRVKIERRPRQSVEALARDARYLALSGAARGESKDLPRGVFAVALGHQADDQVETLLMALLRGSGLPGLGAMAPDFVRHGVLFVRPLLECHADELRAWLRQQGLGWIDDPTNADTDRLRNRLRAQVVPSLAHAAPAWRITLARSAAHAAQANGLLCELAEIDLAQVGSPPSIRALQRLSRARQVNTLRAWLRSVGATATDAQMREMVRQINACTTHGHKIELRCGAGQVRRDGEVLHWYNLFAD